jgi:hypothetical protein
MYGIKSDETRRSYVSKLEFFFDIYKIEGQDIKEKSENFLQFTRKRKGSMDISQELTEFNFKLHVVSYTKGTEK